MVAAASAVVAAAAAASLATEEVDEVLYLLVCCLTFFEHASLEVEGLASQRVVEVHFHLVVGDGEHASVEMVSVFVLQGNDGALEDVLVVEMAVDLEDGTVEVEHSRCLIVAVGLVFCQLEVEGGSRIEVHHLFLKLVECHSET